MIKTEPGRIIIEVGIRFDNVQTVSESVLRHLQDKKVAFFFARQSVTTPLFWPPSSLGFAKRKMTVLIWFFLKCPKKFLTLLISTVSKSFCLLVNEHCH